MNRSFSLRDLLVQFALAFALALLIVVVVHVLAEYFGWHLVREAGDSLVSASEARPS